MAVHHSPQIDTSHPVSHNTVLGDRVGGVEPRDPTPMAVHHSPQIDTSHPVSQYGVVQQQQQAAPAPMQQNQVALDESYGDESYDYGQYEDGSYDDGSGMIDPNTGMPMQGAGADGNKAAGDLDLLISSKMVR